MTACRAFNRLGVAIMALAIACQARATVKRCGRTQFRRPKLRSATLGCPHQSCRCRWWRPAAEAA